MCQSFTALDIFLFLHYVLHINAKLKQTCRRKVTGTNGGKMCLKSAHISDIRATIDSMYVLCESNSVNVKKKRALFVIHRAPDRCVGEVMKVPERQQTHRLNSSERYSFHKKPGGSVGKEVEPLLGMKEEPITGGRSCPAVGTKAGAIRCEARRAIASEMNFTPCALSCVSGM